MATFSGAWTNGSTARRRAEPRARRAEDPLRQRREGEQGHRGERSAGELQLERTPEEPAEPAPVLGDHVAEAVLRQRVLDRQVQQRLEESRRGEHRREEPELDEAEPASRDDGARRCRAPRRYRARLRSLSGAREAGSPCREASIETALHGSQARFARLPRVPAESFISEPYRGLADDAERLAAIRGRLD